MVSYSQLTEVSFDSARVNGRVLIDAPVTCLASHKPSTVLVFSLPFAMALQCPRGPQLPQTLPQSQKTLPQNSDWPPDPGWVPPKPSKPAPRALKHPQPCLRTSENVDQPKWWTQDLGYFCLPRGEVPFLLAGKAVPALTHCLCESSNCDLLLLYWAV